MTEGKNKTPEQKAVEDFLKEEPVLKPGAGLPGRTKIGELKGSTSLAKPHTLTSVASLSAELFSPDQVEQVNQFLDTIENANDKTVFALADGTVTPQEFGIETNLESDKAQALSKVEKWERENKKTRDHEIRLAKINARAPLWPKVVGIVAWVLLAILYAFMAFKDSGTV